MQLEQLGQNYFDFLQRFGDVSNDIPAATSKQTLASACQKHLNGKLCCPDREQVEQQLMQVRADVGQWTMSLHKIVPSNESATCFIKYDISAPQVGSFVVMAILTFDAEGLVTEIDEVFHQTT